MPTFGRPTIPIDNIFRNIEWREDINKYQINQVYETTNLNSLIQNFNEKYNLDITVEKKNKNNYKKIVKEAHVLSRNEVLKLRPTAESFLSNSLINQKINDIYKMDFELCSKYGYNYDKFT